jgi:SAM-dependent methyltransferase
MAGARDIRDYYDAVAADYDVRHGVVLAGQAYNLDTYYAPFLDGAVPSRGRVLEIGCGTGVYTDWLCRRGLDVVAMDLSVPMLDEARRRCPDALYVEGDCQDPAPALAAAGVDAGFEAIVGVNTFSYYPDKAKALANYHRLLRPGGRFVVIDMNGVSPYYALMAVTGFNELGQWMAPLKDSRPATLTRLLVEAGFRVDAMTRFAFIPNGLGAAAVTLLRPFDALLRRLPGSGRLAMRVAYVAVREAAP